MFEPKPANDPWNDDDEARQVPARVWTREEAQALRAKSPPVSPWRVIRVQAWLAVVVSALAWGITGERSAGWSSLYGAAAVVVPGAMMAWGVTRRGASGPAGAMALQFLAWEMAKILLSVALLALAPRIVQPLSWPALLVAMVLCLKVYWLALRWRGR